MQKKKLITILKFRLPFLEAKNDSVIGPTFGQYGIKGVDFCKKFNEFCSTLTLVSGLILKVLVTVFKDKSFSFLLKTPPLYFLFFLVADNNFINIRDIYKITFIKSLDVKDISKKMLCKNILNSLKKYNYILKP